MFISMLNLYIFNETFTNGFYFNLLDIISLLSIICGVSIIISKNPILSILYLIGLFLTIAIYLMMLGLNFIGLSYLLVYVGAVSILFLFILMLINVRISELVTDNNNSIPLAIIIGIIFNMTLHRLLPSNFNVNIFINNFNVLNLPNTVSIDTTNFNNITYPLVNLFSSSLLGVNNNILFVVSKIWDGVLVESSHITSIGSIIYTVYPIWLIITSIILLLAMVGAIIITIKQ